VLVTPEANPAKIRSIYDLRQPGVRVLIGTPTVPIGSYTRQVLRNLGLLDAILPQVASQERDVATIAAKLQLGAADAGLVYVTDAKAAGAGLTALPLPAWAQPPVKYEACVVSASSHRADAAAFLEKLFTKRAQARFKAAGFLLPKAPAKPVKPVEKKT
jgi:molybdate transport system substrate-binding protein